METLGKEHVRKAIEILQQKEMQADLLNELEDSKIHYKNEKPCPKCRDTEKCYFAPARIWLDALTWDDGHILYCLNCLLLIHIGKAEQGEEYLSL